MDDEEKEKQITVDTEPDYPDRDVYCTDATSDHASRFVRDHARNGGPDSDSPFFMEWELYDMKADRTELNNLAEERPGLVEKMESDWKTWADRIGVSPKY